MCHRLLKIPLKEQNFENLRCYILANDDEDRPCVVNLIIKNMKEKNRCREKNPRLNLMNGLNRRK